MGWIGGLLAVCAFTIFPIFGHYARSGPLHGPGLVLSGAGALGSPPGALEWMRRRVTGPVAGRHGNLVVLRASGSDLYDLPLYRNGSFASVQTILIPPCAQGDALVRAAHVVGGADAVFFAGGDQANYVRWKNSPLIDAVKAVYARGGAVGGGSAGLAIQGAVVFDSVAADRYDVETHTADTVRFPLEGRISFTTGLFDWPALTDTITDTHFVARDRFGRLVVFLARILKDGLLPGRAVVYGLGVDQGSAVLVDPDGMATVVQRPDSHGAYLVRANALPALVPDGGFRYTVDVAHVAGNGTRFDLLHKRAPGPWYKVTVDSSVPGFYSRSPYLP